MPRCEVYPVASHAASFQIDGHERLRWYFGTDYPRPFFHPLVGPSGSSLTRIGHPGAPNHDHHLSIWFAHHKVTGVDFWGMDSLACVRQKEWLVYDAAADGASMAVRLQWFDGHDPQPLLEQQLIVQVRPGEERETLVELQTTLTPVADRLEFGRTNFGFLAVRVAKSISEFFGGGRLTDSEGRSASPRSSANRCAVDGLQRSRGERPCRRNHVFRPSDESRPSRALACARRRLDGGVRLFRRPEIDDQRRSADVALSVARPCGAVRYGPGESTLRAIRGAAPMERRQIHGSPYRVGPFARRDPTRRKVRLPQNAYPKTRLRLFSNPSILERRAGVRGFPDKLISSPPGLPDVPLSLTRFKPEHADDLLTANPWFRGASVRLLWSLSKISSPTAKARA